MTQLELYLFGPPRIVVDAEPADINRRKAVALLAYLAATGQPHTRDALAALLWPDADQSRALAYLRTTLWTLNQALGEDWLDTAHDVVQLAAAAPLWLDVAAFEAHRETATVSAGAARLAALEAAAALYTGDFLAGFTLPDADTFNDWQYFEQERLRGECGALLDDLAQHYTGAGRFADAIPVALRRLALDPLHEDAHRQLMRLYAWAGQWSAAQRQYQQCVATLRDELGAQPDADTRALAELITERRLPLPPRTQQESLPAVLATSHPPDVRTTATQRPVNLDLPAPGTPLVGRAHDLDEIARLLADPACRLLTLVGQGGIGKTRLALQTAANRVTDYADGVVFVSLAPVRAVEYMLPALADALRFNGFERGDPQQQLLSYLHGKRMLLVMDNFEHLVEGAGLIADILDGAPGVQVLATSRERLQLRGEWLYETRGLAYPNGHAGNEASAEGVPLTVDALTEYGAVQLFVSSARRVQPDFRLSEANAPAVVRICRLVEGMPLGVELAAAWLQMLTPDAIADEIARSLDFLATDLRDLPARHRSVRAVFESSWERLTASERLVLARLSLFRGSFARTAATQVADASLPLLLALLNRSLLRRDGADSYSMHELLRQFAAEKHDADPHDQALTRGRYVAYYAAWLRVLEPDLKGGAQIDALNAVEAEIDNLRTAWLIAVDRRDDAALLALMSGLGLFFQMRGRFQESHDMFGGTLRYLEEPGMDRASAFSDTLLAGLRVYLAMALAYIGQDRAAAEVHYARVLPRLLDVPVSAENAHILYHLAMLAYWPAEDWPAATDLCTRLLAYFEATGDRWGLAQTLHAQGAVRHRLIDYDESTRLFEQSRALCEALGDFWGQANNLNMLGEVAYTHGHYALAEDYYRQGLALNQCIGARSAQIWCLTRIGDLLNIQGRFDEAFQVAADALALAYEQGNLRHVAFALKQQGFSAMWRGDEVTARALLDEGLAALNQTDSREHPAWFQVEMAELAAEHGDIDEAERMAQGTLPVFRAIDNGWGEAAAYAVLGSVARQRGDYPAARDHYLTALRIGRAHKSVMLLLRFMIGYARLIADEEEPERAVALLALVIGHHATWHRDRAIAEQALATLVTLLGADAAEAAQARGRASTLNAELDAILGHESRGNGA